MFQFIKKLFTPKKEVKDEHLELFEDITVSEIEKIENETMKESLSETKKESKTESTFGI
tara:strand:- start:261 stop:437 length:177 start_codon:yes stop_codon:yes gene_type:complete